MKIIIKVLAFAVCAGNVYAAPITAADILVVDGTEWAQVDLFTNLTWDDINAVCPSGVCIVGGTLNGNTMTDWMWASSDDFNAMFNIYLRSAGVPEHYLLDPDTDFYSETSSSWAPAFFSEWRRTTNSPGYADQIYGRFSNLDADDLFLTGLVFDLYSESHLDQVDTVTSRLQNSAPHIGGWFYRGNSPQIPAPGTLPLLCIALTALSYSRMRKLFS